MKEKKHIRSFKESIKEVTSSDNNFKFSENNLRRINEDEDEYDNVVGESDQDIRHWEVILQYGKPFLKISTDDDTYYCDLMSQYRFNSKYYGDE